MSTKIWSAQQQEIFSEVENGKTDLTILARAGTGKTTTIVEALKYIPSDCSVLLAAFNNAIAKELKTRLEDKSFSNVEVYTLHSFGLKTVAKNCGRVTTDSDDKQLDQWISEAIQKNFPKAPIFSKVKKLVGFAKNTYKIKKEELATLCVEREIGRNQEEQDQIVRIADIIFDHYDILGEKIKLINFDDMVFLPMFLDLTPTKFDFVIVDERQDMNLPQNWLASAAKKKDGRLIVVGDDRQAIYGFRGADKSAMVNIGKTLPLTVTYRCGKKIVEYINQVLPQIDYSAADSNIDGEVKFTNQKEMLENANVGDFIISRFNAPMLELCVKLLAKNRPAKIAGRDIIARVEGLFQRAGVDESFSSERIRDVTQTWTMQRIAEMPADKDYERRVKLLNDDQECIDILVDAFGDVRAIKNKLYSMCDEKTNPRTIILCTAHKAKGLETDNIWVLSNFNTKNEEEENCWYVALTRGKKVLNIVT